jgi:Possible hemagglutinin (DUF637)/Hemagglutinin repeat
MAQLTTDIVWLQQDSITLFDGSVTQALVPHVYAALRAGGLAANDALLSGSSVDIHTTGDLSNSGTILGRKLVQINANTLDNQDGHIDGKVQGQTGALNLCAGRDVTLNGAKVVNAGKGDTNIVAQRDVNLGSVTTSSALNSVQDGQNYTRTQDSRDAGSSVQSGGSLVIAAGNDITARAATLGAGKDASLSAANNIVLQAGQTTSASDSRRHSSESDGIRSKTNDTQTQSSSATAQVNTINGQNVSVQAGNNLVSVGAAFNGQKSLDVGGQNNTLLYATQYVSQSTTTTQSSSGFAGISLSDKSSADSKLQSSAIGTRLISTDKVQIGVGNKTELQGAEVQTKDIAFVKNNAHGAGELILGGSMDTTQTSHTEKDVTAGVYQEAKGQGSAVQTLNQTSLKGNVTFDSALKITAQIPDSKGGQQLKTQLQALAQQGSGLDYLNQLAANPNVKWDQVAQANEHWSYDQAGLTPAGAALLSIAVAAYTGGMGAEMLGGTAATTTSAATLMGSTTLATAVNAGFASLASQAAVAMVNNGGDIGKTLQQLGSEQSIKGLLTTMVTAGALDKLGNSAIFNGQSGTAASGTNSISTAQTAATLGDKLLKNITNNVAGAAIDSAINGKLLDEKALSTALTSALITTGLASGANAIGDARVDTTLNDFTQKVAHAVLGCAGGAATSGGCAAGAVGAVVGEMTAEYTTQSGMNKDSALALAKTLSAASGVLVGGGGDNVGAVNAAATTGANAAENNFLKHADRLALNKAQGACYTTGDSTACSAATALQRKDQLSDKLLSNAAASCKGAECNDVTNFIQTQMNSLGCTAPNACSDYNTLGSYLRVAQEKAQGLEPVYPEGWALDAKAVLDLGKFGVNVLSRCDDCDQQLLS